jgi:hypothetical protein
LFLPRLQPLGVLAEVVPAVVEFVTAGRALAMGQRSAWRFEDRLQGVAELALVSVATVAAVEETVVVMARKVFWE